MNKEQWNDLLEIRKKAGLSPKTDYRFTSLELFLDAVHTLEIFSPDKEKLLDQFNKLSDQDKQDLLSRVTKKTHSSFFHLSNEEVEKLEAARKELPFHERARLSDCFIHTAAGVAWLDLGEVSKAIIELDDRSSPERVAEPYAHIYFTDHYRRRIETIDIIKSIKSDLTAIGHPAIIFAIYHWQQVIYTKRVIERDDITSKDGWGPYFKDKYRGGRDLRSAESNLKAISQTLYDAAKERSIPLESAFALKMQWCGLLQDKTENGASGSEKNGEEKKEGEGSVVYKAWEKLKEFMDDPGGPEEILKKLEPELNAYERVMEQNRQPIYAHRVMEFLKDDGEKGGKRFVGFNEEGNSPRTRWIVFRNAFAAWYFNLDQSSTVATYLKRARKQKVVISELYKPSIIYPQTTVARIFTYLLTKPLVAVREPIALSETNTHIHRMEEAIKEAASNTG